MKKLLLFALFLLPCLFFSCSSDTDPIIEHKLKDQEFYIQILSDSCNDLVKEVQMQDSVIFVLSDSLLKLQDSIIAFKKNAMSEENYIRAYKYERLLKYYKICKNNPSQWKFYKGWSIRVFENDDKNQ